MPMSSPQFLEAVVLLFPNQAHKPSRQAVHGQGKEAESQNRIKSFMCIMDSMTEKELDSANPKLMEAQSRIIRISRGSGRAPGEVVMLLGTPPTVATMTVGTWGLGFWGLVMNQKLGCAWWKLRGMGQHEY